MARSTTATATPLASSADVARTSAPAIPSPAISGAHTFFDEAAESKGPRSAFESMNFTGSFYLNAPAPDPARRERLLRVVKLTMGVVAAIGALALVRIAIDGGDASASDAAAAPSHTAAAR